MTVGSWTTLLASSSTPSFPLTSNCWRSSKEAALQGYAECPRLRCPSGDFANLQSSPGVRAEHDSCLLAGLYILEGEPNCHQLCPSLPLISNSDQGCTRPPGRQSRQGTVTSCFVTCAMAIKMY